MATLEVQIKVVELIALRPNLQGLTIWKVVLRLANIF